LSAARPTPFRASAVFGRTFHVWFTALPQLLLVAALVQAPLVALRWWTRDAAAEATLRGATARALPLADLALSAVAEAFAVWIVLQRLRGERPDALRSLRAGSRRLGTALGITAILNAPNGVNALLEALSLKGVAEAAGTRLGVWDAAIVVFTFVVSIFVCVPIPVALVEERGVIASIGRSWILTRGHRFTIWWVYVLLALVAGLVYGVFYVLPLPETGAVSFALDECGNVLLTSFACVLPNVVFHALREAREGIGSERLAEVFD